MTSATTDKIYTTIEEIGLGGSERRFFRIHIRNKQFILVHDPDVENYRRLQKHLLRSGVAVPKIYRVDEETHTAIIEDLGNDSLYELTRRKNKNIRRLYELAIKELIGLQVDGYRRAPIKVYYDYDHIRWEQEYFRQFFLVQFCGLPARKLRNLDADFENLTQTVLAAVKPIQNFLMHRDYQSQNIYFKNGSCRIIDFQSARIGPLSYDLAALLRDPYVQIAKDLEGRLINYYLVNLSKKGIVFDKREFMNAYRLTGLQRNMQALGAFANLSLNKNKIQFRKHIPRGIALLRSGLKHCEFETLRRIVTELETGL